MSTKRFKYYLWLFRWFVIGNMHCNLTPKKKIVLRICNRVFWFCIIVLIPLGISYLLGL